MAMTAKVLNKTMCLVEVTDGENRKYIYIFKDSKMIASSYYNWVGLTNIKLWLDYQNDIEAYEIIKDELSKYTTFKQENGKLYFDRRDCAGFREVEITKYLYQEDDYPCR